ncbi:MAG: hypothetical protein V1703_00280 [Candidatus Altiarchaeota archaeon]
MDEPGYKLEYSLYAIIVSFIIAVLMLPFGFAQGWLEAVGSKYTQMLYAANTILMLASLFSGLIAIYGFVHLGRVLKNRLLYYASVFALVVSLLSVIPMFSFQIAGLLGRNTQSWQLVVFFVSAIASTLGNIPFGIALFKVKKDTIYRITGALNVLVGLLSLTIVLHIISTLLVYPTILGEALILYKEVQNLKKTPKTKIKAIKDR